LRQKISSARSGFFASQARIDCIVTSASGISPRSASTLPMPVNFWPDFAA
jgi:hypothetical protein